MPVTLIHCSDLHLGRQRLGGKLPEEDLANALRFIVRHTIEREADGLLIAGDLFDSSTIQPHHLRTAVDCLDPLKQRGIPVFAVEGNHDRPSLSNELPTWVRYLNDQGYLHLLSIPFTPEGPKVEEWNPETRRGSYIDCRGVRIVGAGYLGAGTVRRMKAIAEALFASKEEGVRKPTVMLLHAGPEYLVHEGGGFDRESLGFLREHVDYLALGHIHKPIVYDDWAVNPGTAENVRLEESDYDRKGNETIPRGMAEVVIADSGLFAGVKAKVLPVPRRPVFRVKVDVTPFESRKDGIAEDILEEAARRSREEGVTSDAVLRLDLVGRINLQRAGLDPVELAVSLESILPAAAVDVSLAGLNLGSASADPGTEENAEMPRDALERHALMQLLADAPVPGLEDRGNDLSELFMELKEGVRKRFKPEEIIDALARHPAVMELGRAYAIDRESRDSVQVPEAEAAATRGGEGS